MTIGQKYKLVQELYMIQYLNQNMKNVDEKDRHFFKLLKNQGVKYDDINYR